MAEWLGTGLQNLLQRFDSAWYLQKCLWTHSRGICFSKKFFREYAYTRFLAKQIQEHLIALGLDARLLVPELEDISLPERCRRVNTLCQEPGVIK